MGGTFKAAMTSIKDKRSSPTTNPELVRDIINILSSYITDETNLSTK